MVNYGAQENLMYINLQGLAPSSKDDFGFVIKDKKNMVNGKDMGTFSTFIEGEIEAIKMVKKKKEFEGKVSMEYDVRIYFKAEEGEPQAVISGWINNVTRMTINSLIAITDKSKTVRLSSYIKNDKKRISVWVNGELQYSKWSMEESDPYVFKSTNLKGEIEKYDYSAFDVVLDQATQEWNKGLPLSEPMSPEEAFEMVKNGTTPKITIPYEDTPETEGFVNEDLETGTIGKIAEMGQHLMNDDLPDLKEEVLKKQNEISDDDLPF